MGLYRIGMCLLFYSHCLCADSYWSNIPGFGPVKLSELDAQQHQVLSEHLSLNASETIQWLDNLPEQLETLSCDTLDALSQPLPSYVDASYRVISYAGILKWASDDKTKNTVWWLPWSLLPLLPELTSDVTDADLHMHQPLLITEQQLGQKNQFMLVSGSSNRSPSYFALQLNDIHQPKLLWSVSAADPGFEELSGAMAQPLVLPDILPHQQSAKEASLVLPNVGAEGSKPRLYKVGLLTGAVLSRLMAEQEMSGLSGALTLYDQNMDSNLDTVIVSTKAGHLWQAQIDNNQFYNIKLIADLSGLQLSDIQFVRLIYAAVPVGGSGSDFHSRRSQWLVLLSALKQKSSLFVVLKLQGELPPASSGLVQRTLANKGALSLLSGADWQQIQQKSGWYTTLSGRITQRPVVVAGVVYLTVLEADQACSMDQAASTLITMHLHHASSVYRQQILPLGKAAGALAVKANTNGGFALVERNHQQVLIDNLLEISPDCANCSKVMQQDGFPRWQLMGTYHSEEGAYE